MRAPPSEKHRARLCQTLPDSSAANRQCTPQSAPFGASSSPCRGTFLGTAIPKASPARGGVAAGDGGVPHLTLQIPFRAAALSRPPHTLRNARARSCRTLLGISTASRQCTPQSAPSGASSSPCRGTFLCVAAPEASPARGGVAAGDGGVPHLTLQISFRAAALSRLPR